MHIEGRAGVLPDVACCGVRGVVPSFVTVPVEVGSAILH